jgi:hypothetical protein
VFSFLSGGTKYRYGFIVGQILSSTTLGCAALFPLRNAMNNFYGGIGSLD